MYLAIQNTKIASYIYHFKEIYLYIRSTPMYLKDISDF